MALAIEFDDRELRKFVKRMEDAPRRAKKIVDELTQKKAIDTMQYAIMNSTGRPGPNVVTGEYISSFFAVRLTNSDWFVGNTSPQAARLEFGFTGMDSLGRSYSQPPYPHFRPAAQRAQLEFEKELAERLGIEIL